MQQGRVLRRYPSMPIRPKRIAERADKKGSFADSPNGLLPVFVVPDGRGPRRWLEVFGHVPRKAEKNTRPFNALEAQRSSSDLK